MTKRTTTGALLVIGALVAAACGDGVLPSGPDFDAQFRGHGGNKADKEIVCHKGNEISVNGNAVATHLGHGDALGSCGGASSIAVIDSQLKFGIILEVIFTSTNCSFGDPVSYQLLDKDGSDLGLPQDRTGDGISHTITAAPVSSADAPFRLVGDCDDDTVFETSSLPFTP